MSIPRNQSKKAKLILLIPALFISQTLLAADFTIINGQTISIQQVLSAGETGTIDVGGTLDVAAGGAIASGGGNNQVVINNGTINANGVGGTGVNVAGGNVTITNTGSINATAVNSYAISIVGANATISNSGSISANASGSNSIFSNGANATITNSGNINANAANSNAIDSSGADATINNSGTISASDATSFAIKGGNNDITLNLLSGSNIIGRIDLGGAGTDNDTVNIRSTNISGTMFFENTENVNFLDGTAGVVVNSQFDKTVSGLTTKKIVTVETTGESTRGVTLSALTSRVHNVLAQPAGKDAPLNASADVSYINKQSNTWAQVFGGAFKRDADGNALAYDYSHSGVIGGYEKDLDQVRVGIIGGYANTKTETKTNSFKTKGDNLFVGAYSVHTFNNMRITSSVIGGLTKYDNERLVIDSSVGAEVAKSDFTGWFISPSITVDSSFKVSDKVELRPSASLNYSVAWLDGYDEKGTTNSNLSIDSRKVQALTARAQLEAAYSINTYSELALRVGMNSRYINDDDTDVSIAGSNFSFSNSGDQSVTGGFAGISFRAVTASKFNIVVDVEVGGSSKGDYVHGKVGIEYLF